MVKKSGQGCLLIFPTKNDQEQAQLLLEQEYKVSLTTQQKRQLLPKLKICCINHFYKKQDKDFFKMTIQEKNSSIDVYINTLTASLQIVELPKTVHGNFFQYF